MIKPTKIRTDANNCDPTALLGFPVFPHREDPNPHLPQYKHRYKDYSKTDAISEMLLYTQIIIHTALMPLLLCLNTVTLSSPKHLLQYSAALHPQLLLSMPGITVNTMVLYKKTG